MGLAVAILRRFKAVVAVRWAAAAWTDAPIPNMPVQAMGLTFANPLGLAAGFDRNGGMLAQLGRLGFGHVEVGSVAPSGRLALARPSAGGLRVGVNVGSRRYGLGAEAIEDYAAALRRAYGQADYIVAAVSSPFLGRRADTPGVERLVARLKGVQEDCAAATGRRTPLLLKIQGGADDAPIPPAAVEARRLNLDGVVLVSSSLRRIGAIADYFKGAALISVGGVRSAEDVRARIAAGAALVQMHTEFVRKGPSLPRRLLAELSSGGG